MRLWIVSLLVFLGGCDMLPAIKDKIEALPPVELKIEQSVSAEFRNKVKVTRSAYSLTVPLAKINNEIRFAATARVEDSRSNEPTLRYSNPFAGIALVGDYWRMGWAGNDDYYRLEMYGNVPVIKSGKVRLIGGISHQNAHNLKPGERRFKKTEAMTGVEVSAGCKNRFSLQYHAGNHGSDDINDALVVGWRHLFGCAGNI